MSDQLLPDLKTARNQFVVRSNEMIQNSRYHLTRTENCIVEYMISKIRPEDDPNTIYEFHLEEFSHLMRYKTDSFTELKRTIKRLADKSFWYVPTDPEKDHVLIRWFDIVHANPSSKILTLTFHQDIKPFLFQLYQRQKKYSQYKLGYVLMLEQYYSQRLYAILCSYSNNASYWFEIGTKSKNDLYVKLCEDITHKGEIPQSWLDNFGYFRSRVLDPSVKEINEYTNLHIEYETSKKDSSGKSHRGVCRIIFTIEKRTPKEIETIEKRIDLAYQDYDSSYRKKLCKQLNISDYLEEEQQTEKPVLELAVIENPVPVSDESANSETEIVEDTSDCGFIMDVFQLFPYVVSEIQNRTNIFSAKELAAIILEAERHIGPETDKQYKESWIRSYITFYLDQLLFGGVPTKTSLFNRLMDSLIHDYKHYAGIVNNMFLKKGNDDISRIFGKYNKSVFVDCCESNDYTSEFIKTLTDNEE